MKPFYTAGPTDFEMTSLLIVVLLATCPNATPIDAQMLGVMTHRKVPHAIAHPCCAGKNT